MKRNSASLAAVLVGLAVAGGLGWSSRDDRDPQGESADRSSSQAASAGASLTAPLSEAARLASLPLPDTLQFAGIALPMQRPDLREAIAYELILTVGKPTMPLLWMRRAPLVLPEIEAALAARGLPEDLKYLPMIESDLRWTARSPAGAVGLWQFMDSTARRFGLRIDAGVDQRMDPTASTEAGLRYLSELHRQYGDWLIAFAAYNSGEGTVTRAIQDQGARSYFDMFLPYETRRYVPRLVAAKLVYEQPERYGLVRMTPLFRPTYSTVEIEVTAAAADLRELARRRGLDYARLRLANPQIKGVNLGKGRYRFRVPDSGPGGTPAEAP